MKHATTDHIRRDQHTRTENPKATVPAIGRVRKLDAEKQRCGRSEKGQTEIRSGIDASNDFLKCVFLPKLKRAQPEQASKKTVKLERDFYLSLSRLATHYHIEPMQTRSYGNPYNIALALWDVETKLKQRDINWDNLRLVQDGKTYFVSEEKYRTGSNLYYIPVVPLFLMLHDREKKKAAQLLLSVCSYLYHIVDIPYYRQEASYHYWMYEMLSEWIAEDEKTDENLSLRNEWKQGKEIGDRIEKKLFNRINLKVLAQRMDKFKNRDAFDKDCLQVARMAFALYTDYPNANVFQHAPINDDPDDDEDEQESISMDRYIAFVADTRGLLYDNLSDSVNNDFNEFGAIDEPTIIKRFDGRALTGDTLDFENRLFALLKELCSLLHEYKSTENE